MKKTSGGKSMDGGPMHSNGDMKKMMNAHMEKIKTMGGNSGYGDMKPKMKVKKP